MTATKFCSKCQETKPITEYHKNITNKDGLQCWCRTCHYAVNSQIRKNRYQTDPEFRALRNKNSSDHMPTSKYLSKVNVKPKECAKLREMRYEDNLTLEEIAKISGRAWSTVLKHTNGHCNCNY